MPAPRNNEQEDDSNSNNKYNNNTFTLQSPSVNIHLRHDPPPPVSHLSLYAVSSRLIFSGPVVTLCWPPPPPHHYTLTPENDVRLQISYNFGEGLYTAV